MARKALGIGTRRAETLGSGSQTLKPGREAKRPETKRHTNPKNHTKIHTTTLKFIAQLTNKNATNLIATRADLEGKMIFGYARVSTTDQETTLQIDALKRAYCETIYQEKTSSVGARPELKKLLKVLKKDDLLIVYKLDRLARSLKDLLSILEQIEQSG